MADLAQQPYDPGEELIPDDRKESSNTPYLHSVPGTGKSDGVPKGNLSSVPDSKKDSPEELSDQEKNTKGPSRTTSTGNELSLVAGGAAAAGAVAAGAEAGKDLFNPTESPVGKFGKVKNFFAGSRRRKQATVGGGLVGVLLGGGIFGLIVASGPAQLVQLSEVLKGDFKTSEQQSSSRLGSLFRNARANSTGDIGETRVGILGSKYFGSTIGKLNDIGIEFQRTKLTGSVTSITIDTGKLAESYPELTDMTQDEQLSWLANKFDVPENLLSFNDGVFTIDTSASDFGIGATRALTGNTLDLLDGGQIVSGLRLRVMTKFFNAPSLFHPLKRAIAGQENKYATTAEQEATEEERVEDNITEPASEATELPEVESALQGKLSGITGNVGSFLLLTSGMCLVRSVSTDVVDFNRDAIVVPAALEATDLIAVGDQIKSGQDISAEELGPIVNGFTNSQGQNIWQGRALQVTEGESDPGGTDIPGDYQQAFSNDTTAANINNYLGGAGFGSIACSTAGQIIQGLAGVALAVSGFFDGGTSWAGFAAAKSAEVVATGGVMYLIEHQLINILKDKAIVPAVLSGPLGGNIAAYGAREAAGIGARAAGGVALAASTTSNLVAEQQQQSEQQFRSESFFARIFDIDDYRSLMGHLADSFSPSASEDLTNFVGSLSHLGSSIPHIFASILPGGHAQADSTYTWGFPQYAIPPSVLNNPAFADPYANAADVATLLSGSQGAYYINTAATCFGVSISNTSGSWEVTPNTPVNPNSDTYVSANCSNTSDTNWDRVMLFVFDTNTMEAAACYAGDDTSCQNIGVDGSTSPPASGTQQAPQNGNIYIVGDSLTVGMQDEGQLTQKLQTAGWNVNQVEATVGDTINDAIPKVTADTANVSDAGTVLIGLGTNDYSEPVSTIQQEITNMVNTVRGIDPNANIDWINTYSSILNMNNVNTAISSESAPDNFKIIDWQNEVNTNPGKYTFDTTLGVHLSGAGYALRSTFVVNSLGTP